MRDTAIFEQNYRVIAVDAQSLILKGVLTGDVLTIRNADGAAPLSEEDYPPGKLIALNNPSDQDAN
jgi:hypothetical protein